MCTILNSPVVAIDSLASVMDTTQLSIGKTEGHYAGIAIAEFIQSRLDQPISHGMHFFDFAILESTFAKIMRSNPDGKLRIFCRKY